MTERTTSALAALAALPLAGLGIAAAASPASAATGGQSYQADLQPLNNQTGLAER